MIEHHNIAIQMAWLHDNFNLGENTTILQKTAFSFDAAQWELLANAYGVRLIFGSSHSYRDPHQQIKLIREFNVTTLQCVPTLWRALLETEQLEYCTSLQFLFSGGEALPRELARDCLLALPGCRMINLYGPTECTINAASYEVTPELLEDSVRSIPIGFAVQGTELLVMDESGIPVAAGRQGEIYVGGSQVGRGYIGRDDLTRERFLQLNDDPSARYYRTGDIGLQRKDGALQFMTRADGQVKLNGYRIELDEIRSAIENHDWVKSAGVFIKPGRNENNALIACVEMSPNQAQLMDGTAASSHHRSKSSKVQVKAQLSGLGMRLPHELDVDNRISMDGCNATRAQENLAFGRKSYRHYEGKHAADAEELLQLINCKPQAATGCNLNNLTQAELGTLLRNVGQFQSNERLLPKYAYASPGALYATQIYVELSNVAGLPSALYYYHPREHALYQVATRPDSPSARFALHFVGKNRAIEPVYKLNIREVLDFETGHILGLLDAVLADHGLAIDDHTDNAKLFELISTESTDYNLGSVTISGTAGAQWTGPTLTAYLQVHDESVQGIAPGFYRVTDKLEPVSTKMVEKRHVIAINQRVYDRASFGIALCANSDDDARAYVALGRALQRLQQNDARYGFMSSGYSSRSGNDQRVAVRLADILGARPGACYFCVGGRISDEQYYHRGMKEDAVHTQGPTELIYEDLKNTLPHYMLPNHLIVVDSIPQSANGKVDVLALQASVDVKALNSSRPIVAPRTRIESDIAIHWSDVLDIKQVSIEDDFFQCGGNSLSAVTLMSRLNDSMKLNLALESLFEDTTIRALAKRIESGLSDTSSRSITLTAGQGHPIYCWPGLGGYPMNLRPFADQLSVVNRPVMGIQAVGLNAGEVAASTVTDIASLDVDLIKSRQPTGPYTLIGYSFGARLAFETAYQLESKGEQVDQLILVAPGNPVVYLDSKRKASKLPAFDNPSYLAVLLSIFTRTASGSQIESGLEQVHDDESYVDYIFSIMPDMDRGFISRVLDVARKCYDATYIPYELPTDKVKAPITLLRASNDNDSFLESASLESWSAARVMELEADHYQLLKPGGVDVLAEHVLGLVKKQPKSELAA